MENVEIVLPQEYINRLKTQLGEKYIEYENCLKKPAVRGIRINPKRITENEFKKLYDYPLKKLDYTSDGFIFDSDEKIGNSFAHVSGLCYFQEPSSMIPVCASKIDEDAKNDLKILDLCASPGGKTSQIASIVSENSVIFSNEVVSSRVGALYSNVERQGYNNVLVLNERPERLRCFEGYFDYVFVDAPCSGEGMFRKNPQTISEWSDANVYMCANRQKQILEVATKLVKTGGKLIYSTCTFSKEEDEDIVLWLLSQNYNLLDIPKNIKAVTEKSKLENPYNDYARKFYPFSGEGEGQFVAVFKNNNENENLFVTKKYNKTILKLGKSEHGILKYWIMQTFKSEFADKILKQNIVMVGENIFALPQGLTEKDISILDELRFESLGVKLGSLINGRFEPNHAIFMAYHKFFNYKVELSQGDAIKFLHGEQLDYNFNAKAYGVVTINDFPLGGAKLVGGKLKNLLPKGLRI